MKLFGKFSEYTINEICLYATPIHVMQQIMKENSNNAEIIVKEYRPKKYKKLIENDNYKSINDFNSNSLTAKIPTGEIEIAQDKTLRHQIVAVQSLLFAKISVYSIPMSYIEIERLGLTPIDKVIKKERVELAMEKLSDKPQERGAKFSRFSKSFGTPILK
jgi:hypothetical protein